MKIFSKSIAALFVLVIFSLQGAMAQKNKAMEKGSIPDEKEPVIEAVKEVSGKQEKLASETLVSEDSDKSVLVISEGASLNAKGSTFEKKAGDTSNESQSNFFGLNAAVVVKRGSSLNLDGVTISTSAEGANALFATGKSSVKAKNIKIRTKKNSSRGLDATYGGAIQAQNVDIETEGAHSAAFATDRGEGNVNVEGGSAHTRGEGSPVVYSTGNISVKNIRGSARSSEIAVVEGKNSASMEGCTLFGGSQSRSPRAVMLYQSMSGDARKGNASMSIKNCSLFNSGTGPFFYVTNTSASVLMENTKLESKGSELLHVSGNNSERGWGKKGANGGKLDFTAVKQNLTGDIFCDAISSASLKLTKGSTYMGTINSANGGKVNVTLDKKSKLVLTGNSFVNVFVDEDETFKNIASNGHNIFYNKNAKENAYLNGTSVSLLGGGKLVGVEVGEHELLDSDFENERDEKDMPGRKGLPQVKEYEGKISLQKDGSVVLVCGDKNWKLSLAERMGPGEGKGMGERPELPPDGAKPEMGGMKGQRPKGNAPDGKEMPPRPITLEDLKKLDGETVVIKGVEKEDGLIVFMIEKK